MERFESISGQSTMAQHFADGQQLANDNCPFVAAGTGDDWPAFDASVANLNEKARPEFLIERIFDIVVAAAILAFILPLMLACCGAVRLSGPGPLLFRQKRIGRDGTEFTCLKFRTMICFADSAIETILNSDPIARSEWQRFQKLTRDPRITPVGQFMRRYSLDELPQLINVLAGHMSIVGPRPIVAAEVDRYGTKFSDYCRVKPGLTGLWQVSGRHQCEYDERVRLDSVYARSKSVRSDIIILFRTVPVVLLGQNE